MIIAWGECGMRDLCGQGKDKCDTCTRRNKGLKDNYVERENSHSHTINIPKFGICPDKED